MKPLKASKARTHRHRWFPAEPERGAGIYRCDCGVVGRKVLRGRDAGAIVPFAAKTNSAWEALRARQIADEQDYAVRERRSHIEEMREIE